MLTIYTYCIFRPFCDKTRRGYKNDESDSEEEGDISASATSHNRKTKAAAFRKSVIQEEKKETSSFRNKATVSQEKERNRRANKSNRNYVRFEDQENVKLPTAFAVVAAEVHSSSNGLNVSKGLNVSNGHANGRLPSSHYRSQQKNLAKKNNKVEPLKEETKGQAYRVSDTDFIQIDSITEKDQEMAPNIDDNVNDGSSNEYDNRLMWTPTDTEGHELNLIRRDVNAKYGLQLSDYKDLHRWSVQHCDLFWHEVWNRCRVVRSQEPTLPVIDKSLRMDKIPKWFSGASLNYAENLLRFEDDEKTAFFYSNEAANDAVKGKELKSKTFGEFKKRVAFIAQALRDFGIVKGDRVAGYLPNFPESIEIMAAVASIGAVWSSTSPDFGSKGVLDRFAQISPRIIFSVESVFYKGRVHDHLAKLDQVVAGLPDLEKVVVIPYFKNPSEIDLKSSLGQIDSEKVEFFGDFIGDETRPVPELVYEQVTFDHPLFIMYSSGTTGAPKCIVHSVGGTLLKHLEEHQIQGNRKPDDVLFYYTTVGWMMWNWMVTALCLGTTLVLYDGSPMMPKPDSLWDLVDDCGITVFGISAPWIAYEEDVGVAPAKTHKLTTLKAILSTGAPLAPRSYDFVYSQVKEDVLLGSISGGTDIIACFLGENSILPVHRGEIQSPHLGCDVQCWDPDADQSGARIYGRSGEMVIPTPFISMPVYFYNDPEGSKYFGAYFDSHEGVWTHGDFIREDERTGGILMLGRSDGTLNPSGVRFGSAEIYNVLDSREDIADLLCVGQSQPGSKDGGNERVVLFVKMAHGLELTEDVKGSIRTTIRSKLSARHVPSLILPIVDIPYTINGKKVEVAVKKILNGKPVKNQGALRNAKCLDLYKDIPELKSW